MKIYYFAAEPLLKVINESSELLFKDVGGPIIKEATKMLLANHISKFFENVAIEEFEIA